MAPPTNNLIEFGPAMAGGTLLGFPLSVLLVAMPYRQEEQQKSRRSRCRPGSWSCRSRRPPSP